MTPVAQAPRGPAGIDRRTRDVNELLRDAAIAAGVTGVADPTGAAPVRRPPRSAIGRLGRERIEAIVVGTTATLSVLNYLYTVILIWLLPPTQFVVFASVSALLLICGTVSGASSPWVLAREVARFRHDGARRRAAVSFSLVVTLGQAALAGIITCVVAAQYADGTALAVTFGAVIAVFSAGTAVGYLQGWERFEVIAVLRIGETVVKLGAGVAFVVMGAGAAGAIGGFALGAVVVVAVGLYFMRGDLGWAKGSLVDRDLWHSATGLMAVQTGAAVMASVDVILGSMLIHDPIELGSYQSSLVFGRVAVYVATALSMIVFPRLAAHHGSGREHVRASTRVYAQVCIPAAVVVATLPDQLVGRIFPSEYVDVPRFLPWVALSGVAVGGINLATTFFQAVGSFRATTRILVVGVGVTVAADLAGLRIAGMLGIAVATTLGALVVLALLIRQTRQQWPAAMRGLGRAALLALVLAAPLAAVRDRVAVWVGAAIVLAAVPAVVALLRFRSIGQSPDARPRVLHLGYEDPRKPGAGGGSVRTHEINRRLADQFDITVVCARYPGARARTEDGVRYVHAGLPLGYFSSLVAYFAAIPWSLLRRRSDLVVEDFGAPFSSLAVPRLTGRPVVGVVQWLFAGQKREEYHLPFDAVERYGLASHRRLVAVSDELADEIRSRHPGAEVTVVYNGLDEDAFAPRQRPRRDILFLGRLEIAQKGLDLLLDAFAIAAPQIEQDLVLGGDGPDRAELEDQIRRLGLGERVRFVGRIPADERFDALAGADLVAMPSRYESFGMVAAEAMAVATPVVAFDIPCLRALVTAETGARVDAFDVDALAQALVDLGNDADRRRRLGDAGPRQVEGLRWDLLAHEQAAVYRAALAEDTRVGATGPIVELTEPVGVGGEVAVPVAVAEAGAPVASIDDASIDLTTGRPTDGSADDRRIRTGERS